MSGTDRSLVDLRALDRAATHAPWSAPEYPYNDGTVEGPDGCCVFSANPEGEPVPVSDADAALIAAARNALPLANEVIAAARELLDAIDAVALLSGVRENTTTGLAALRLRDALAALTGAGYTVGEP